MTATAPRTTLTDEQRQRRQKEVNTARASVRLEGFILDDETETLNARYVAGELTSAELTAGILKLAGRG